MQGRKGVVSNFRFGVRDAGDQCGFAGIGHAEQAHIGQDLELQAQASLLTLFALGELPWRTVYAGLVADVADTAKTALRQHDNLAVGVKIKQNLIGVGIVNHRSDWHAQDNVICTGTVLVRPAPMFTVARHVLACITIVNQGVDVAISLGDDAAAFAAITSIRSTLGDELFATKARRAVAAFACDNFNGCFVYEFHHVL